MCECPHGTPACDYGILGPYGNRTDPYFKDLLEVSKKVEAFLDEIKAIGDLPTKEVLMAQIAGSINAVATKVAVGINEVPSGLARALKQHADSGES